MAQRRSWPSGPALPVRAEAASRGQARRAFRYDRLATLSRRLVDALELQQAARDGNVVTREAVQLSDPAFRIPWLVQDDGRTVARTTRPIAAALHNHTYPASRRPFV